MLYQHLVSHPLFGGAASFAAPGAPLLHLLPASGAPGGVPTTVDEAPGGVPTVEEAPGGVPGGVPTTVARGRGGCGRGGRGQGGRGRTHGGGIIVRMGVSSSGCSFFK